MNILIIGNGFDLAHGLKTTYKHFLDYWEEVRPRAYLEDWPANVPIHWEKEHVNVWFNYFSERQQALGDTWIDFENEIYNVIKNIKPTHEFPQFCSLDNMQKGFLRAYSEKLGYIPLSSYEKDSHPELITNYAECKYCNHSKNYLFKTYKGLINFLYDQLREFTKAFERYLTENVDNLSLASPYQLYSSEVRDGQQLDIKWDALSFNYTNTLNRLYQSPRLVSAGIDDTVYVHGKAGADDKDCDLVLGTHSFDRNGVDKGLSWDLNIFAKHNQRHKYGTIEAYQDILRRMKAPINIERGIAIGVIGHSLDKTDHNILKHIFTANKNARINIYYHDEESQEKLINNITEIIGEAEVMAKVRFIYQHDEERGLLRFNQKQVCT